MCWAIWMVRNDAIFRNIQSSIDGCRDHFKKEFALVLLRAKENTKDLMSIWGNNIL